jgi:predicted phosphodiesterase
MNQWFASNQDLLFTQYNSKIKAWFYGHTHTPSVKSLQGIPFYCNPIGYPGENKDLDFNKVASVYIDGIISSF